MSGETVEQFFRRVVKERGFEYPEEVGMTSAAGHGVGFIVGLSITDQNINKKNKGDGHLILPLTNTPTIITYVNTSLLFRLTIELRAWSREKVVDQFWGI